MFGLFRYSFLVNIQRFRDMRNHQSKHRAPKFQKFPRGGGSEKRAVSRKCSHVGVVVFSYDNVQFAGVHLGGGGHPLEIVLPPPPPPRGFQPFRIKCCSLYAPPSPLQMFSNQLLPPLEICLIATLISF